MKMENNTEWYNKRFRLVEAVTLLSVEDKVLLPPQRYSSYRRPMFKKERSYNENGTFNGMVNIVEDQDDRYSPDYLGTWEKPVALLIAKKLSKVGYKVVKRGRGDLKTARDEENRGWYDAKSDCPMGTATHVAIYIRGTKKGFNPIPIERNLDYDVG